MKFPDQQNLYPVGSLGLPNRELWRWGPASRISTSSEVMLIHTQIWAALIWSSRSPVLHITTAGALVGWGGIVFPNPYRLDQNIWVWVLSRDIFNSSSCNLTGKQDWGPPCSLNRTYRFYTAQGSSSGTCVGWEWTQSPGLWIPTLIHLEQLSSICFPPFALV